MLRVFMSTFRTMPDQLAIGWHGRTSHQDAGGRLDGEEGKDEGAGSTSRPGRGRRPIRIPVFDQAEMTWTTLPELYPLFRDCSMLPPTRIHTGAPTTGRIQDPSGGVNEIGPLTGGLRN